MDVVLLGKARYADRPSFVTFLDAAASRGHSARLLSRREFLHERLIDDMVVLAKSHYHDPRVQRHLIGSNVRVINQIRATDRCRSRRAIAARLRSSGVATPPFLASSDGIAPPLPWIVKPDGSDDHRLEMVRDGDEIDVGDRFVQQFLAVERTIKVYVIGDRQHGVELFPRDPSRFDLDPQRSDLAHLDEAVRELATVTGQALGLEIFNVDMVLHDHRWWVVDVNPFPRLEPVPNVADALWDLIDSLD